MTSRRMAWLMAGAVAISTAAPALAQDAGYQQQLRTYEEQRSSYEARRADYDSRQAQYDADRTAYERARSDYDRRYGSGAYDRRYPDEARRWRTPAYPTSNDYYGEQRQFEADRAAYERARDRYDARNGRGAYDRRYPDEARRYDTSGYDNRYADDYDAQRRQWEADAPPMNGPATTTTAATVAAPMIAAIRARPGAGTTDLRRPRPMPADRGCQAAIPTRAATTPSATPRPAA